MNLPTKQADDSGRSYEYVIDNTHQMIVDGELQAGQRLPSEQKLAEKFNVSRIPIREVLKTLEYMGVLGSGPDDGTYVKNTFAQSLVSKMDFSFDAAVDTIRDLLELHIVLETFAACHVAQRHTDKDIASIQKLLRDMWEARKVDDGTEESVQNLRKLSHGFHQALIKVARNAVLSSIYEYLYELLDISWQLTIDSSGISYNSIVAREVLFSKVVEGDTEEVHQCIGEHMEDVHYNLESIMGTDHPGQKAVFGQTRSEHE